MIRLTTLSGTKDVLSSYCGGEYCILYVAGAGFLLVGVMDMEGCEAHNVLEIIRKGAWKPYNCGCGDNDEYSPMFRSPTTIAHIPESIMIQLIDEGFVVKSISDKEWAVQVALGTAPTYRPYLISGVV